MSMRTFLPVSHSPLPSYWFFWQRVSDLQTQTSYRIIPPIDNACWNIV